jgi:hypothetical protein
MQDSFIYLFIYIIFFFLKKKKKKSKEKYAILQMYTNDFSILYNERKKKIIKREKNCKVKY